MHRKRVVPAAEAKMATGRTQADESAEQEYRGKPEKTQVTLPHPGDFEKA